jgi:hypothetical protein
MTNDLEFIHYSDIEERVIAQALEDPAYKQRLLNTPKAVLEETFDMNIPDDVTIQVLQQSPKHLYLLLPIDPAEFVAQGVISESELEAIAGGVNRTSRPSRPRPSNGGGFKKQPVGMIARSPKFPGAL